MPAPFRAHLALLLVGAALLSACGKDDSPAGPTGDEGEVRFSYSGTTSSGASLTGTHRARGTFTPPTSGGTASVATWAVGARNGTDSLGVASFVVRGQTPPSGDLFGMVLPGVSAPATLTFSLACDVDCPLGVFVIGAELPASGDVFDTSAFDYACVLVSGTARVTSVAGSRARGTFGGQALCVVPEDPSSLGASITISGGSFDVPVRTDVAFPMLP